MVVHPSRRARRARNVRHPGQGLVEYALVLVLIAVAAIGAVTMTGGKVSAVYSLIGDSFGSEAPTLIQRQCVNNGGNPVPCTSPALDRCYIEVGPPSDGAWVPQGGTHRGYSCP